MKIKKVFKLNTQKFATAFCYHTIICVPQHTKISLETHVSRIQSVRPTGSTKVIFMKTDILDY